MYTDRDNKMWLGVCAGIADQLEIPAALVRVVFVICVLAWPPLALGYFITYYVMEKDLTPEKMRDYVRDSETAEHFRQLDYRKPIYRNERNKRIAGVCSGIADYLEVSTFVVRLLTFISLFVFGPFTFWGYIICWIVFDRDPFLTDADRLDRRHRKEARRADKRKRHAARMARRKARSRVRKGYVNEEEVIDTGEAAQASAEFAEPNAHDSHSSHSSRAYSRDECTHLYSQLETRLRDIEAYMTSKRFRLHCEINRI